MKYLRSILAVPLCALPCFSLANDSTGADETDQIIQAIEAASDQTAYFFGASACRESGSCSFEFGSTIFNVARSGKVEAVVLKATAPHTQALHCGGALAGLAHINFDDAITIYEQAAQAITEGRNYVEIHNNVRFAATDKGPYIECRLSAQ